jgi:hypothetical protein
MEFFVVRAETGRAVGRCQQQVDADYKQAAALAALAAPYRHARLSAVKLAGGPHNPLRIRDDGPAARSKQQAKGAPHSRRTHYLSKPAFEASH